MGKFKIPRNALQGPLSSATPEKCRRLVTHHNGGAHDKSAKYAATCARKKIEALRTETAPRAIGLFLVRSNLRWREGLRQGISGTVLYLPTSLSISRSKISLMVQAALCKRAHPSHKRGIVRVMLVRGSCSA